MFRCRMVCSSIMVFPVMLLLMGCIEVPDVTGMTESAARYAIESRGLVVGTVSEANSAAVAAGLVLGQAPSAGVQVSAGSAVGFTLSLGEASVSVPDVTGMTEAAARQTILERGLVIGTASEAHSATVAAGQVIIQDPSAGTLVSAGSAVGFTLSLGEAKVSVPDVTGMTEAAARQAIESQGLTLEYVGSMYSTGLAEGLIMRQNPEAGAEVGVGEEVSIVISRGVVTFQPLAEYTFPVDTGDERYFSTQGDMGEFGGGPSYQITQENGALRIVTRTVNNASSYGGFWHSTIEKAASTHLVLDPAAPLPWPVKPAFQPHILGIYVRCKGQGHWRIELKQKAANGVETEVGRCAFPNFSVTDYTEFQWDLPANTPPFKLVSILAETGTDIRVDEIGYLVEMPDTLTPLREAFLVSLGQLLRCYDHASGQVRDRSNWPVREEVAYPTLDQSRSFNAVPGLGFVALAVACAEDLGYVESGDAQAIVQNTTASLLNTPAHPSGFLSHWTRLHTDGSVDAHPESEYSSVDTALCYISSYIAADMLGLDTEREAILDAVRAIDFDAVTINGHIGHGFAPDGSLLDSVWSDFGGETSLVHVFARLNDLANQYDAHHQPGVAGGTAFIAEISALFFPHFGGDPAYGQDAHGVDWHAMRLALLAEQKAVLNLPRFLGGHSACEIISAEGHHAYLVSGTQTGEISLTPSEGGLYDDFGTLAHWLAPHYRMMTASLEPGMASADLLALRQKGLLHPLCGPAESMLLNPDGTVARWHSKQVAINGFFSALGSYHGVVGDEGRANAVYAAVTADSALDAAVNAVFLDLDALPASLAFQGEHGTALPGSTPTVMQRGSAENLRTMQLYAGEGIAFAVDVPVTARCSAVVRYSNDNYGPLEQVQVLLVNTSDASQIVIGTFNAKDTGNYGAGWDVFLESDTLGSVALPAGGYELQVVCLAGTGDGYGVEIDRVRLDFERP